VIAPVARGKEVKRASTPKKRVVCIDDDDELLSMLRLSIQELGFNVSIATNGEEGLAIISSRPADVIVIDYSMPGMDGEALAREIRLINPATPIIMYSGVLEKVPEQVLALVDEFVSKREPISNLLYYVKQLASSYRRNKRAFPRYAIQVPFIAVTEDEVPAVTHVLHGESNTLSEGGMGGTLNGKLHTGGVVRVQLALPSGNTVIESRASVRYHAGSEYGFQFLDLSPTQKQSIRQCLYS
jgi:CheY-like chemotaxis protein